MVNTITDIVPKILARGLLALRERAVMPRLVNTDYGTDAKERGDTVDVPVPSAVASTDVTPGATNADPGDVTINKVQIQLSNWKKAGFHLSDKDLSQIDANNNFIPMQMGEAVRALANDINISIHNQYKGVYGCVGTHTTNPFSSTVTAAVEARKLLNKQKAPTDNRRAVINFDVEANMLALPHFSDVDKAGDSGPKIEGTIGRKFGFDWYTDDAVVKHTAGTLGGQAAAGNTIDAAASAGATTVKIRSSVGGTLLIGDIFTIAGDSQTYTVTANATFGVGASVTVAIAPPLQVALVGNEQVTVYDDHRVNLAFHRDAFAMALRPLQAISGDYSLGNEVVSMQDPQTGLILRLEVSRQNKRVVWEMDALWGAKLIRPELAVRLAGLPT